MTVVYYLHFCIFASSIYPRPPLLFAIFSARYQFGSATITNSLVNFIFALQVNIALSLVRIRYISPVSLISLSICFHPICPAAFGNNQLRLLLEFIFGFKLKTALVPSIVKLPTTKFSIHFQYHPTWTSIAELPAPEFSIHFYYLQVWYRHPNLVSQPCYLITQSPSAN